MSEAQPGSWQRALAQVSANCPVCRHARRKQAGWAFWLVSRVERRLCPFCRAYEKVHQRPSHDPVPGARADKDPAGA